MKKIALLSVLLVLAGCASRAGNYIGTVYQIGGPVKDVEILGLVYVKCEAGEPVYQALLRAAEKKGGNGIANVIIDVDRTTVWFFGLTSSAEIRYASALAIKYTEENITSEASGKDGKLGIPSTATSPYITTQQEVK
jgi:hypothetical protein